MRILYLDVDSLRADHLGCYGYHRNTSPTIDRIALQGIRFDNYYCSDAPCLPSRTAMMSGRFGIHTGVVGHGGTAADPRREGANRYFWDRFAKTSLPATLTQAGLHTCYIGGFGARHAAWHFQAGFREIHDTGKGGMESAEDVTPTALDWIRHNAQREHWFLHVNYWDPHGPYRAPASFGNPFEKTPLPSWPTAEILERHRRMAGPHGAQEIMMYHNRPLLEFPRYPGELRDMRDLRRLLDGYDCGIRHADDHFAMLLAALEKEGVGEDLAIIISADHAESMGELGIYAEHGTADQATCRIPFIVRWPGVSVARAVRGLHYNLDLAPTLADLLGLAPQAIWDGRSFASAIREGCECGRPELVLSQCAHVAQRSVRWDRWLYLRTYHDGYHLFPQEMLFDVESDPYEERDLASTRPDLCREAVHRLVGWHDAMMLSMSEESDTDPLWTVLQEGGPFHAKSHLADYCQRLEATGRGDAIPELKRRHPREFRGK